MTEDPKEELKEEERQPCEVWTRVMGYHRPVSAFNAGKKSEHEERTFFKEPEPEKCCKSCSGCGK